MQSRKLLFQTCQRLCTTRNAAIRKKSYLSDSLAPTQNEENERNFQPQKFLLLRKITRYEFEKKNVPSDSEEELKKSVSFNETLIIAQLKTALVM